MNESAPQIYQRLATGERFDLAVQTPSHVTLRHETTGEFTMIDWRTFAREYIRISLHMPTFDDKAEESESTRRIYQHISSRRRFSVVNEDFPLVWLKDESNGLVIKIPLIRLRADYERILPDAPAFDIEVPDGETVLVGED